MHDVDDRLDEIEQILAIYESKLDLPEDYFEDLPDMPAPIAPQQAEVVARTENPLQDAFEPVAAKQAVRAKTEKKAKGSGG